MQQNIENVFRNTVIPVLTIGEPRHGVALARALADGGLDVLEVTLRTDAALEAIAAISEALPNVTVGVGTVTAPGDFERAERAGARFSVSPGATPALVEAACDSPIPWLPGSATVSEAVALLERGIRYQKLFPAATAGGVRYLDAVFAPLPGVFFCPTGGLDASNASEYLARPNVVCVGGSWVAPKAAVESADWAAITGLATHASALARAFDPVRAAAC